MHSQYSTGQILNVLFTIFIMIWGKLSLSFPPRESWEVINLDFDVHFLLQHTRLHRLSGIFL
jgi:hypothetical protein